MRVIPALSLAGDDRLTGVEARELPSANGCSSSSFVSLNLVIVISPGPCSVFSQWVYLANDVPITESAEGTLSGSPRRRMMLVVMPEFSGNRESKTRRRSTALPPKTTRRSRTHAVGGDGPNCSSQGAMRFSLVINRWMSRHDVGRIDDFGHLRVMENIVV